jgi:hypothetical protein
MTGSRPIGATRAQSQTRPSNLNGDDALTETPAGASNAVLVDALISVRSFLVEGDCLHWRRCRMGGACRLRLSRKPFYSPRVVKMPRADAGLTPLRGTVERDHDGQPTLTAAPVLEVAEVQAAGGVEGGL